jgi:predicted aspartyl protease
MIAIIPLHIFPIEDDGYHVKIVIEVNRIEVCMILDTGASRTVFDENKAANFIGNSFIKNNDRLSSGIGTTTMTSKKVMIDELRLGKIKIENYDATILDLSHVNQSYQKLGLTPVDGVLGGDILKDYNAIIDYGNKELRLFL